MKVYAPREDAWFRAGAFALALAILGAILAFASGCACLPNDGNGQFTCAGVGEVLE